MIDIIIKYIADFYKSISVGQVITIIIDIAIVSLIFYLVLKLISATRALQLVQGLLIFFFSILIVRNISEKIGLVTLNWVLSWVINFSTTFLPLLVVVVFQPELRRLFGRIGKGRFMFETPESLEIHNWEETIDEIIKAVKFLSLNKIGALICIERETGLEDYIETGVSLDALVKAETLSTIFTPNSSLHDGGAIIRKNRVVAARCLFPLATDEKMEKGLGTRHRAALGITEETDAIVVVVSEQTGVISLAVRSKLTRYLSPLELRGMLLIMTKPIIPSRKTSFLGLFKHKEGKEQK